MDKDRFLHEVEIRAGLNRDEASKVALVVLQELHDRLSPKEADDLGAQLPGELKAKWHGFDLPGREVRRIHKGDFVRHIAEAAQVNESTAIRALMATFKALQMLLKSPTGQEGEAWDVLSQLPKDLKKTWLAAASMGPPNLGKALPAAAARLSGRFTEMKCPKCKSDQIEVMEKTAPAERVGWRHHHAHCRKCRTMLWWSAPVGALEAVPKTGEHQCAFFAPAAALE